MNPTLLTRCKILTPRRRVPLSGAPAVPSAAAEEGPGPASSMLAGAVGVGGCEGFCPVVVCLV